MTLYRASKEFNIPWSTLKSNVERVKTEREDNQQGQILQIKMLKIGRPFSLSVELEQNLVTYIIQMQEIGYGLTVNQIRRMAFELAETAKSKHTFNSEKKCAGWNWWVSFKERYGLSLRTPENLSSGRAICSNPSVIVDFYDKLQEALIIHNLDNSPERIWNCDETGLMYVNKPSKIVTKMGKKYVYNRTYAEKGTTTTVLACINAAGYFIPPLVIFKGVRNIPELSNGAMLNSLTRLSPKGWINADLFFEWLVFFYQNIPPTRPVLLIMDSHASHVTLKVLEFAKSHQIILFTMPAHTSHILQPLDVGVFRSLKMAWRAELQDYKLKHPNLVPTRFDFHKFLTPVYEKCFTTTNIRAGFRKTGIYPLDRNAVCSDAIAPSTLSDKPVTSEEFPIEQVIIYQDYDEEIPHSEISNATQEVLEMECEQEQPSGNANAVPTPNDEVLESAPLKRKIEIHDILILPKWEPNTKRQKRTVPKAQCLTPVASTSSSNLSLRRVKKEERTKQQQQDSHSSKPNKQISGKKTSESTKDKKSSALNDDWICRTCSGLYSQDVELQNGADWITCSFCTSPYHTHCQSQITNDNQEVFMCDGCSINDSSGEE